MPRPFFETLRDLRGGRTLEELGEQLQELVGQVKATGKGGELHLKLRFKPPRKGGVNYITVEDDITTKIPTKIPKNDRGDTVFFPTEDNGLSKHDPRQHRLSLGAVDAETGEITVQGSAA